MFSLQFRIDYLPFSITDRLTNGKAISIRSDNCSLAAQFYYDFHAEPLILQGNIAIGDRVRITLLPYRIELYINDKLIDEEWPCGNLIFDYKKNTIAAPFQIELVETEPRAAQSPAVISQFNNAEGWKPEETVFVGDCMPYVHDGRYHVLYLKDRHHHTSKWGLGAHQWAHISTCDFDEWQMHPMAVEITRPWEGSICTGSWIKNKETEYLFYTIRMADRSAAPICRSISEDGYHFKKDEQYSFILPDRYNKTIARDPKVIKDSHGIFHMILTTALLAEKKGCLAHLTSEDLDHWEDQGPIYVSDDETQPECPDYFHLNGWYYLLFSLHTKAYYLYSDKPFTGWKTPADPFIPCASVPKGAVWEDHIVFTGYQSNDRRCYAGVMTFASAAQNGNGELLFK